MIKNGTINNSVKTHKPKESPFELMILSAPCANVTAGNTNRSAAIVENFLYILLLLFYLLIKPALIIYL